MKPSKDSSVRIHLLGWFEIIREGRQLRADEWSQHKAAMLLKYLAIYKRLVKEQAIDLFWLESDLETGSNNFYLTLHELRQTLNKFLGADTAELAFEFEGSVLSSYKFIRKLKTTARSLEFDETWQLFILISQPAKLALEPGCG